MTGFANVGGWTWNYSYMDDISVTPSVILSADLGDLYAEWGNGPYARLNWDTYEEVGVDHFELQRSIGEANEFQTIQQIDATGGPDKAQTYTQFDHEAALNRPNYYRLKVVDSDGAVSYSKTVELTSYQPEDYLVRVYPNPVNAGQGAHLLLYLATDKTIQLSLTDLSGKQLRTQTVEGLAGTQQVTISTEGLPSGYFLLNYRAGDLSGTEKLVVD